MRRRLSMAIAVVLIILGGTGLTVALSGVARWGQGEEGFVLRDLRIHGNVVLTESEVRELSGARMETNVLCLDIPRIEASLSASPRIERAQVSRALPGRMDIVIEEKLPIALVASGGELAEIAEDGTLLPAASRTAVVDLPLITGALCSIEPGGMVESADIRAALEFLERARDVSVGLLSEISEVKIVPGSGLVAYAVADGAEIKTGSGHFDTRDLECLWLVLSDLRTRGAEAAVIDMCFEGQVVVALR